MEYDLLLKDEEATLNLGRQLSKVIPAHCIIYLTGDLGAGKTTLVRGFLNGLGFQDRVKSPTYALFETYDFDDRHVYHVDLYRLKTPEELNNLGLRDYFDLGIFLIEWPERAEVYLPTADICCDIAAVGEGRKIVLRADHESGEKILEELKENF